MNFYALVGPMQTSALTYMVLDAKNKVPKNFYMIKGM